MRTLLLSAGRRRGRGMWCADVDSIYGRAAENLQNKMRSARGKKIVMRMNTNTKRDLHLSMNITSNTLTPPYPSA
jgi:hypothetical protein